MALFCNTDNLLKNFVENNFNSNEEESDLCFETNSTNAIYVNNKFRCHRCVWNLQSIVYYLLYGITTWCVYIMFYDWLIIYLSGFYGELFELFPLNEIVKLYLIYYTLCAEPKYSLADSNPTVKNVLLKNVKAMSMTNC